MQIEELPILPSTGWAYVLSQPLKERTPAYVFRRCIPAPAAQTLILGTVPACNCGGYSAGVCTAYIHYGIEQLKL